MCLADFATLVFNSGQPNAALREHAEKQLREFAGQNLPGYVAAMTAIVADETKPPQA